jgi:glycosyltransferase involved in cell wall biosynthesis
MQVFQVLPGGRPFAIDGATSVELCVADWVSGSRFRDATTIVAAQGGSPLLPISIHRLPPFGRLASWRLARAVRAAAKRLGCDLIVCQQHIATAARVAAFSSAIPVVLQTHNFVAPPQEGPLSGLANALTFRRLQRFGGITFISEATRADFEKNWPSVSIPRAVVTNAFDFADWRPATERRRTVIAVGRAEEYKGLLEAAEGVARFLADHPDWDAVFALAFPKSNPGYSAAIAAALAPPATRAQILSDVRFESIKKLNESASIAVVASKWREPFGRTALEAHAGGAAVVSSGTGGLREISGDSAIYLEAVTGDAVAAALAALAADETRRARLACEGAERVRRLFSLARPSSSAGQYAGSLSQRLDAFYERVVAEWRKRGSRRTEGRDRGLLALDEREHRQSSARQTQPLADQSDDASA